MKKIAIQGIAGSFHEDAAYRYFGESVEILECGSFKKVCDKVDIDEADYAVMAIENSIAGSLLNNYALVRDYHLKIIGEVYVHIQMNLMVVPGVKKEDIREIHSHPIALKQCAEYIEECFSEARLKEKSDTAAAAKILMRDQIKNAAAIGNQRSAELYGLEILEKGIETNKKNYTRFMVLAKHGNPAGVGDKASICFEVGHFYGALARVLNIFAENKINLTSIQSIPIIGKPQEYSFYADVEWDSYENYERAIHLVLKNVSSLSILGEYLRGELAIHNQ
ncbi:MAG: prephenate dehydratase [Bacteroidota bacterium]|nr:prephenate dehydratase [Bacteroidota bacterium]MDP4204711.1 prephenate dehydratase [Bacteroidota bacterium]